MNNVVEFPAAQGTWLGTIEIYRDQRGRIIGKLVDMPADVIDGLDGEPADKMVRLSMWMKDLRQSFVDQAVALSPPAVGAP